MDELKEAIKASVRLKIPGLDGGTMEIFLDYLDFKGLGIIRCN